MVSIYFPRVAQNVFAEEAKSDLNETLSYFGGVVGAVMGFSIISFAEMAFLVYRILLVFCSNESVTLEEAEVAEAADDDDDEYVG
ncbi:Protein EGAS-3 [Aphelenchoides avenae]|nr:Protein EGAS-3 [Aphelenchus avenae]